MKVFIGIFLKGFVNSRMSYALQLFEISVTKAASAAAAAAGGCTVRAARQSAQSSGFVTFSSSRPPVTRGSCPPVRRKPSGRDIIKGRNASAGRPSTRLDFSRGFCYAPVQYKCLAPTDVRPTVQFSRGVNAGRHACVSVGFLLRTVKRSLALDRFRFSPA